MFGWNCIGVGGGGGCEKILTFKHIRVNWKLYVTLVEKKIEVVNEVWW